MSLLNSVPASAVGTSKVVVYTVPSAKFAVLIGANLANLLDTPVKVDIILKRGTTEYTMLRGLVIPPNAAYTFSGDEQKLVLIGNDQVIVKSNTAASVDAWLSMSEME